MCRKISATAKGFRTNLTYPNIERLSGTASNSLLWTSNELFASGK